MGAAGERTADSRGSDGEVQIAVAGGSVLPGGEVAAEDAAGASPDPHGDPAIWTVCGRRWWSCRASASRCAHGLAGGGNDCEPRGAAGGEARARGECGARGFPRWRVSCLCRLTSILKNRFWRGSGGRSNRHFGDETSAGWAEIASWHALQGALGRVSAPDLKRLGCNHLPTALDFSVRFRYNAGSEPSPDPVARGARPTGASGRSAALE